MLDSGAPRETLLHDSEWRCFVKFADVVPQLDEILSYRNSLEHVSNAMYNLLSEATLVKIFCLTNEIRLALLSCYKELNEDRIPLIPCQYAQLHESREVAASYSWFLFSQEMISLLGCMMSDRRFTKKTAWRLGGDPHRMGDLERAKRNASIFEQTASSYVGQDAHSY